MQCQLHLIALLSLWYRIIIIHYEICTSITTAIHSTDTGIINSHDDCQLLKYVWIAMVIHIFLIMKGHTKEDPLGRSVWALKRIQMELLAKKFDSIRVIIWIHIIELN